MKRTFLNCAALSLSLFISVPAWAGRFANQFIEFELPPQWQCNLESAEWVCQGTDEAKKRDAVIILAAKLRGQQDSLDKYEAYLKNAKTFKSIQGRPVKSEPKHARSLELNGQSWVDALHLESEIPGFYTRYLATIKNDIAVLVTYSINKTKYQQYLEPFENLVKTLKVFRKPGTPINTLSKDANLFNAAQVPAGVTEGSVFPGVSPQGGSDTPIAKPVSKKNDDLLIYGGVAAALLLFFIIRKRRQGGGQ